MILFGVFLAFVHLGVFGHVFSKVELRNFKNETASLVMSDDGRLIGKFFADNRTNVEYEQLPVGLVHALVATEDARYFEHEGVDSRSLFRVLIKSILLQQKSAGGGSTITQQLAKNMYGRKRYGFLSMPVNKTKEIILANRLEDIYSKEDILTLYLNTVPFGENVLGIEAAAHRYFNKSVKQLKVEEGAVLIGMLKANTYYNPRLYPEHALERRNVVLKQMEKYGYLSAEKRAELQNLPLHLDYANLNSEGPANYFLVRIRQEAEKILEKVNRKTDTVYDIKKSGLVIHTTLDYRLQQYALAAFKSHLGKMQQLLDRQYAGGTDKKLLSVLVEKELERLGLEEVADVKKRREVFTWKGFKPDSISVRDSIASNLTLLHAGLLAMNPQNGFVKAWVGGIDYRTQPYDQIFAQRQTASAFKPILYASAIEQGALPCQYLDNEPIVLEDFENWQPQNYDRTSGGKFSLAGALSKSMNIPTVNLFFQQDFGSLNNTWQALGFTQGLVDKPSTALGTATASVYEMAIAYSAFANQGNKVEPVFIREITDAEGNLLYRHVREKDPTQVIETETAELVTAMLEKAVREGTGTSLRTVFGVQSKMAGKTGTSQDYGDAWFLAYSNDLIVASRVGATYPVVHFNSGSNGSGSRLALPLVGRTLQGVTKDNRLRQKYLGDVVISEAAASAISCQDHIDDSEIEKFFDRLFTDKNTTFEKAAKKAKKQAKKEKRKSWFKRLFSKNN